MKKIVLEAHFVDSNSTGVEIGKIKVRSDLQKALTHFFYCSK